jgi:adenine-specific DNA-methyltransferase
MTRTTEPEPITLESADPNAERLAQLQQLFPEAFTEGRVNFDKLRATLGDLIDDSPERYTFTWAGKRDAIRLFQTPTRATLVPCREESVNFNSAQHIFIEGENLEVLKLLYKPYFGRVKMIYIDPPYNTGNDFIYPDDYADPLATYLQLTGQQDAEGNLLTSNPETSGRYHSAWLSMMYPRLFLARQLLREDGVIFVSIDDHEVHNLRLLMNEVFGEENFIAQIVVLTNPKGRVLGEHFAQCHDYILVFSKAALDSELSIPKTEDEISEQYPESDEKGRYRLLELRNTHRQFGRFNRPRLFYPLYIDPERYTVSLEKTPELVEVYPVWDDGFEGCWTWGQRKVERENHLLVGKKVGDKWKVFRKAYAFAKGKVARKKLQTIWTDKEFHTEKGQAVFDELIPGRLFQSPKPVELIKRLTRLSSSGEDIILDFFAGSCTTAQAVLELNREDGGERQFIMVQLPEPTPEDPFARQAGYKTIAAIGKERIRRVIARMREEQEGQLPLLEIHETLEDLGVKVFKLARSNYRPWRGVDNDTPDAYTQQMALFADPLVDNWTTENVIYEVALKEGYGLNCRIEPLPDIANNTFYRVTDSDRKQSFTICLDNTISLGNLSALNLAKDDLFICRDVALDDEAAANLALQCRLKTI